MSDPEFERLEQSLAIRDRHLRLLGEVSLAWAGTARMVSRLFRDLSGMDTLRAEAVFFSIRTDAAQRDMTVALADVALADRPELRDKVRGVVNSVGKLARHRNLALHKSWGIRWQSDFAMVQIPSTPDDAQQDWEPVFRRTCTDLMSLNQEIWELCFQIRRESYDGSIIF